jgi:ABC-type phosphate/phosphonate transport system substrate-binding protein
MHTITLVSMMSDNARPTYQAIAGYLGDRAGIPAVLVTGATWQEQERLLDQGQAEVGFVCGLPYTRKVDRFELLAAPVMRAARYHGRPIYFSDVVVRADGPFRCFADLRGATLAYNDAGSFSGYAVVRAHLAALRETAGYFDRVVESGAHLRSLQLIAEGAADAAAIDSLVLELELARRPELGAQVRVVEAIGPSPIPPVIVARHVPAALQCRLRRTLLRMHEDDQGRAILFGGLIDRFVEVHDADYDDLRHKVCSAEGVRFVV